MWRDDGGRALSDYPRPSVAVDVVLLTVRRHELCVLLHRPTSGYAAGRWCLPGTFVREDELLADAALRAQRDKIGIVGGQPRQLEVFDALARDQRGRVLSVAHVDLVREEHLADADPSCAVVGVDGERAVPPQGQDGLPYDHDEIVAAAVRWARRAYRTEADPSGLLREEFTLLELQRLHEAVLQEPLVKDTFRRSVIDRFEPVGRLSAGVVGRPAALYRRR